MLVRVKVRISLQEMHVSQCNVPLEVCVCVLQLTDGLSKLFGDKERHLKTFHFFVII